MKGKAADAGANYNRVIAAGSHDSFEMPWLYCGEEMFRWRVRFAPSCRYLIESADKWDWNKLCGFTEGFAWGRKPNGSRGWLDSSRIAWRWEEEAYGIRLGLFTERGGIFACEPLCLVPLETDADISLGYAGSHYISAVSSVPSEHDAPLTSLLQARRAHPGTNPKGVSCGLWFGGTQVAPHRMELYLKRITT